MSRSTHSLVVPAQAGTQCLVARAMGVESHWIPACAGMTDGRDKV